MRRKKKQRKGHLILSMHGCICIQRNTATFSTCRNNISFNLEIGMLFISLFFNLKNVLRQRLKIVTLNILQLNMFHMPAVSGANL